MNDLFMIPVTYNGKELEFGGRMLIHGYIHRIEVIVDDIPVLFEPDEEQNYRALITVEQLDGKGQHLNKAILASIAGVLHSLSEGKA
jgi:hypothetical protein